ncbi:MAG: glycosyl hydrolase family 18 protein [Candidatus Nanopelagicales bacterium]
MSYRNGRADIPGSRRIALYYQTTHVDQRLVSMHAAIQQVPSVTAVIAGAVHLHEDAVRVNDVFPDDPGFADVWADLAKVQAAGVPVLAMLGGAAQGTFALLDGPELNEINYSRLADFLRAYQYDGVDLDVEEEMSLAGIERLIRRLRADFGPEYLITLAPVDTALSGGENLSGFDYEELFRSSASLISWMNVQFYCGVDRGTLDDTSAYEAIVARGVVPADMLVAGTITHPMHGRGFVPADRLVGVVRELIAKYPRFGGLSSWEYFNSEPGGLAEPWRWAAVVRQAMDTAAVPATGVALPPADATPEGASGNSTPHDSASDAIPNPVTATYPRPATGPRREDG